MSTKDDITINGQELPAHEAWLVRQAVLLFAEQIKNFKVLGAEPVDLEWISANVVNRLNVLDAQQAA